MRNNGLLHESVYSRPKTYDSVHADPAVAMELNDGCDFMFPESFEEELTSCSAEAAAPVSPETGEPSSEPFLYDSKDLTTHAFCVGMTGSGKTGLCVTLLEEAAIDGIPAIAIDPKGDLGNTYGPAA